MSRAQIDRQLKPGQFYGDVLCNRRSAGLTLSEFRHAGARKLPHHSHELAYFCLLLDGTYCEQFGSREISYKPMTIMFHPPGTVHHDAIGEGGGRFFSVELEPSWLERLREYAGVMDTSTDLYGGELVWLARRLYQEYKEADGCSVLAIEGLMLEMLAIIGRLEVTKERRRPLWLSNVIDLLHEEFQRNLTVDEIAHRVGIHPFHLSKVFREFHRQTIGEYLHRLRVQFACRRLSQLEVKLADVAFEAGFADQSHFTRVFKRVTGTTPGAFRAALMLEAKRGDGSV